MKEREGIEGGESIPEGRKKNTIGQVREGLCALPEGTGMGWEQDEKRE